MKACGFQTGFLVHLSLDCGCTLPNSLSVSLCFLLSLLLAFPLSSANKKHMSAEDWNAFHGWLPVERTVCFLVFGFVVNASKTGLCVLATLSASCCLAPSCWIELDIADQLHCSVGMTAVDNRDIHFLRSTRLRFASFIFSTPSNLDNMTTIHEIILATLMILSWHYSTVLAVGNSQDILSTGVLDESGH